MIPTAAAEMLFGRLRRELIGFNINQLMSVNNRSSNHSFLDDLISRDGDPAATVFGEALHKNGRHFSVEVSFGVTQTGEGNIYIAVIRDITQELESQVLQNQLHEQLLENEQNYRITFDKAAVGIARVGLDGNWLEVNPKITSILGYTSEELLATSFQALTHPADLANNQQLLAKVVRGEVSDYNITKRYIRKNGEVIWADVSGSLVRDCEGNPINFISVINDITERKRFEESLQSAKLDRENALRGLELAAKAGGICVWSWDSITNVHSWDSRMYELYGIDPAETISYALWLSTLHKEDRAATEKHFSDILSKGEILDAEFRIIRPFDGQLRWVRAAAIVIKDSNDKALKMFGINQDITREYLVKQTLVDESRAARQANEAKSRFLANMSHEIRTPMNGIVGMVDVLRDTGLNSDQQSMIGTIRESAYSLLDIINDILDFSKIEAGQMKLSPVIVSLPEIIERSVESLWLHAGQKQVDIFIDVDLSPISVVIDPVTISAGGP